MSYDISDMSDMPKWRRGAVGLSRHVILSSDMSDISDISEMSDISSCAAYPNPEPPTSWLFGGAVEQRPVPLELMGCGTRLCRVGGMADHRLHAADPYDP